VRAIETRHPVDAQNTAIDFYFDFISPYGWIGAEQIGSIARRFERALHWHPILLKATVLEAMRLPPPLETPLKGPYLINDIKRSLRYHGLPLSGDARFGFSSVSAARAVLWVRDMAPDKVERLVLSLYRTHWSDGRDISDLNRVLDLIAALGLPRKEAAAALLGDAIKVALHAETAAAIEVGIFGSPTFVIGNEIFWGADRLSMMEAWIEKGGW